MKRFLTVIFLLSALITKAQPVLKGGLDNFIQSNLSYPAFSYQNCIQGTIRISFKVNRLGEVYSSRVKDWA
jgi:outer membrane biosynthesis protein TonB